MKTTVREFIAVRFEIELPLKKDQLDDAIGLLEGLCDVMRKARTNARTTRETATVTVAEDLSRGE